MSDINQFTPLWGEWEIEAIIGEGSFGKVYKAVRNDFGHKYYSAIKHIAIPKSDSELKQVMDEHLSNDISYATEYYKQLVTEINNEIVIMHSLRGNTNIVAYEDHLVKAQPNGVGYDIFIRMELLTELSTKNRISGLNQNEVIKLGIDICKALEICSKHKLIHRDIKPQNIFINTNGDYKLGDFGISRKLERTTSGLSKKGTYSYMAPEVYKGDKYSENADIYSLGIVMYRLLNGNRLPLLPSEPAPIRFTDSELALQRRMKGEQLPAPLMATPELANVILRMCTFNRDDRYKKANEVRNDLQGLLTDNEKTIYGNTTEHYHHFEEAKNDKTEINEATEYGGIYSKTDGLYVENTSRRGAYTDNGNEQRTTEEKNALYKKITIVLLCAICVVAAMVAVIFLYIRPNINEKDLERDKSAQISDHTKSADEDQTGPDNSEDNTDKSVDVDNTHNVETENEQQSIKGNLNEDSNEDSEDAFTQYKQLIDKYERQYGAAEIKEEDEWYDYIDGVAFARLIDFSQDGEDELLIVYLERKEIGENYDEEGRYSFEVWEKKGSKIEMIRKDKIVTTGEALDMVILSEYKGKPYVVSGHGDGGREKFIYYGYNDGSMQAEMTFAMEWQENDVVYVINGEMVWQDEWDRTNEEWGSNNKRYMMVFPKDSDEGMAAINILDETKKRLR